MYFTVVAQKNLHRHSRKEAFRVYFLFLFLTLSNILNLDCKDCGQNWYCNHFQITVEQ